MKLTFKGFLVFENRLKEESAGVIRTLKDANMVVMMVTGDNAFTAINIGFECGIVEMNKRLYLSEYCSNGSGYLGKIEWKEVDNVSL